MDQNPQQARQILIQFPSMTRALFQVLSFTFLLSSSATCLVYFDPFPISVNISTYLGSNRLFLLTGCYNAVIRVLVSLIVGIV